MELHETPYRRLTAKLQFPEDYPATSLAVHLQSPCLSPELLDKLAASATAAAAARRGGPQASYAIDLLSKFITTNRLAPAFNDLSQLRTYFAEISTADADAPDRKESPAIKFTIQATKQACGEVAVVLRAGEYHVHVRAVVPSGYPAEPLHIEVTDSNLPAALVRVDAVKAADMAARLAEFKAPDTDVMAASARAGAGVAATSRTEQLARDGKQTVTSFNKGKVRRRNRIGVCRACAPAMEACAPCVVVCVIVWHGGSMCSRGWRIGETMHSYLQMHGVKACLPGCGAVLSCANVAGADSWERRCWRTRRRSVPR